MPKFAKVILLLMPVIFLAGCTTDGGINPMIDQGQNSSAKLPEVSGAKNSKPSISAPQGNPPSTLQQKDIFIGDGKEAIETSILELHYTLMTWSSGQIVQSSWDSGETYTNSLSNLIPGWQKGIPGMKEGGRRLLVIPADLGYGEQGAGAAIGPNETLIFVVDLVKVS